MTGCEELIKPALRNAFLDSISIYSDDDDCMVQFPFVRSDGDPIRVWVIDNGGSYTVTDEGDTYGMLFLSGIDVEAESREARIKTVQERFGLDTAMFEVSKSTEPDKLGKAILEVYEAANHIAALTHSRKPYAQDDFRSVVANYFDTSLPYEYRTNVSVNGYAEAQTLDFEFINVARPTYMQAIRAQSGSELHRKAEDAAYKYWQVGRVEETSQFLSLIDDERGIYSENQIKPLLEERDDVIRWSNRERIPQSLAG